MANKEFWVKRHYHDFETRGYQSLKEDRSQVLWGVIFVWNLKNLYFKKNFSISDDVNDLFFVTQILW